MGGKSVVKFSSALIIVLLLVPIASAESWNDIGSDKAGDQTSEKKYLDLCHFYCAAENGCIMLKIECGADIPTDTKGEHGSIAYNSQIDSRDGGDTYYNDQWGTKYGWDYNIELDYDYGSVSAWLLEYKEKQWVHVGEVKFKILGNTILLFVPLELVEIKTSEIHFEFASIDNDGSHWWFADVSDTPSTISAINMPSTGYLGLTPVGILGFGAISISYVLVKKRAMQKI